MINRSPFIPDPVLTVARNDVDQAIETLIARRADFEFADIKDELWADQSAFLISFRLSVFIDEGSVLHLGFRRPACKHERATPIYRGVS
jgi:hypothetical protein